METSNLPNIPSQSLPPWLDLMRKAAMEEITVADVKDIIRSQVKLAKTGNPQATKFIFEQVLGGSVMKGATFVQNVFSDRPDKPTKSLPGTKDKLNTMARRAAARRPLYEDGDGITDEDQD